MNVKYLEVLKKIVRKTIVYTVMLIGFFSILIAFSYKTNHIYSMNMLHENIIQINHVLITIIGLMLIILSLNLKKRMKSAWIMITISLPIINILNIMKMHSVFNLYSIIGVIVFVLLIFDRKYYCRITNPLSLKKAILIYIISFLILILNTAVGLFLLKNEYAHINHFYNALIKSIQLLFLMDKSVIEMKSHIAKIYVNSVITLNWTLLISAFILIMKPLIYTPVISILDRVKVRKLINKFGNNPLCYLTIEEDKLYYFGKSVNGVIAYTIQASVAVCAGDPICDKKDIYFLLTEFMNFCKDNELDICFCQTTDRYLKTFSNLNFGHVKYGEEAMFKLKEYNLEGGKLAKVRHSINHADKLGINIIEYCPNINKDNKIENDILEVSKEWLSIKKSSELSFMLGSIGLNSPMDRRYFLAYDMKNVLQGFIVFTPFNSKKGYYADVTRRRSTAPFGVMEKILISAFEKMKSDGVELGSLGLCPLANMCTNNQKVKITERVLDFIYENMNNFYGFKSLYTYKKNFSPSFWETRYLVYYPKKFTPKIAYSIIKAQNPKGVKDYILTQLKMFFK
jgi:phosphatidylglycerol lysyltransferase